MEKNKKVIKAETRYFCLQLCVALLTFAISPAWAALDIFDHPKEVGRSKKAVEKEARISLLDYPNECFLKGNYEEALSSCKNLLGLEPAKNFRPQILYIMGLSCLKLGRSVEARSYFDDILFLENSENDLKTAASIGAADSYFLEGNFDKALDAYNQILVKYPQGNTVSALYYKTGVTLEKMGRPDDAKIYFSKLKQEFPLSFEARLAMDPRPAAVFRQKTEEVWDTYTIQVGCFGDKDNADKLCEKLVSEGFSAYIYTSGPEDAPQFHVRVGRLKTEKEAAALEDKLKIAGYPTKICP